MRAYVVINRDETPAKSGDTIGTVFPFMTKHSGIPIFVIDGNEDDLPEIWRGKDMLMQAQPGMVGMTMRGVFYSVLSNLDVVPMPIHIMSCNDHDLFLKLCRRFHDEEQDARQIPPTGEEQQEKAVSRLRG